MEVAGDAEVGVGDGDEFDIDRVGFVKNESEMAKFKNYDFCKVSGLRIGLFELQSKILILLR